MPEPEIFTQPFQEEFETIPEGQKTARTKTLRIRVPGINNSEIDSGNS